MDLSRIESKSFKGKLLRFPLRLLRPGTVLPILSGRLLGKKWIVDSSLHSCWLGTFEHEKQLLFSRTVSRKSIVFDLGGNVGFYTLLAARLVGKKGKVIVFEPRPENLYYLRKHLELNKSRNVTVIEAAVSYKNDWACIDADPRRESVDPPSNGQLLVKTCSLDKLLELGQVPIPDTIRMNIGGAEFHALCGAKSLLSKAHPAIFLTTHGKAVHRECCAFLEMMEYRLSPIDGKPLDESREMLATHF